jgi:hypothetical protein
MFSLRGHERALIGSIEFELVESLEASVILELGLLGGRGKKYKDTNTVTYTGFLTYGLQNAYVAIALSYFHCIATFGYVGLGGLDILRFPLYYNYYFQLM